MSEIIAYTDGSFNAKTQTVGASAVIVSGDRTILNHYIVSTANSEVASKMRQITGELAGCINAVKYAIDNNLSSITICYDYIGVENWTNGSWKTNNEVTKAYQYRINALREYIDINFEKVNAHTGVALNERADQLAKFACGVENTLPVGVHARQVVRL